LGGIAARNLLDYMLCGGFICWAHLNFVRASFENDTPERNVHSA